MQDVIPVPARTVNVDVTNAWTEVFDADTAGRVVLIGTVQDLLLQFATAAPSDDTGPLMVADAHGGRLLLERHPGMGLYAKRAAGNSATPVSAMLYDEGQV